MVLEHVAHHEAGHALYGWMTWPHCRIHSVTIVPSAEDANGNTKFGQLYFWDPSKPLPKPPPPRTPQIARSRAMLNAGSDLAGIAAECIRFGGGDYMFGREWATAQETLRAHFSNPSAVAGHIYSHTEALLREPPVWRGVERLAAALLEHGTLDNDQAWAFACGSDLPLHSAA